MTVIVATKVVLGNPMCCRFSCRQLVGSSLELFDPPVVQCTWLNPNHVEDLVTYGGSGPGDTLLTRLGLGVYQSIFISNVLNRWRARPRWEVIVGGVVIPYAAEESLYFDVTPTPFHFADSVP